MPSGTLVPAANAACEMSELVAMPAPADTMNVRLLSMYGPLVFVGVGPSLGTRPGRRSTRHEPAVVKTASCAPTRLNIARGRRAVDPKHPSLIARTMQNRL